MVAMRPLCHAASRVRTTAASAEHFSSVRLAAYKACISIKSAYRECSNPMEAALQQGVGIAPGSAFFPQTQPWEAMQPSFGENSAERIKEGVANLDAFCTATVAASPLV